MLLPRKLKHRKSFRGKMPGNSSRGNEIAYGKFALKATSRGWLSSRQIEAARRAMTRYIKRGGEVWIRVFPDKPVTAFPNEVGMGGGKGALSHFVAVVTPGRIMFEMDGVSLELAKEAMRLASHKLPVKSVFITKE